MILGCLASLLAVPAAQAQSYPSKTITIVVTAATGGVTDLFARALGQRLSEDWGQPVVIENKGGAAHIVGAQYVAKAPPDGHTLLLAEAATFVLNPVLIPKEKRGYDLDKDFVLITGLIRINQALIANNDLPASNVRELIALAKKRPGELTYGTAGFGSAPHMNMVKFENMAHVSLQPVHYRGAAQPLNDIMAGHINLMSVAANLVLQPFEAHQLKVLAVGSRERMPQLPDTPTVSESGLPGYEAGTWFGLAAPSGTPGEIVAKINTEVRRVLDDPVFRERVMAPQLFESMASSPEEFQAYIRSETRNWAKILEEQKLSVE